MESRLDSALAIQDVVFRNTVLTDVAEDAARDKNVEVVKKAIAGITDTKLHDTAAHSCAMTLWVSHQREAAKEVAKTITDQSERDDLLQFLPMSDSLVPRLPPHPATFAPAGSNRSGDGGNEIAEAFDGKGREAAPH